jgi:hypothetical protein
MYINDELKHELKKAFTPASGVKEVTLFDAIPPKKLKNATSSYASSMGSDETIVALCDSTVFGSAKEGFLLTSKHVYSKAIMEKPSSTEVGDIIDVLLGGSPLNIHVATEYGTTKIDTPARSEAVIHKALCDAIKLLGGLKSLGTATVEGAPSNQDVQCLGCGAVSNGNAKFCEYCGADLSATKKASATTVVGDVQFYKEHPSVPDFGAIFSTPLVTFNNLSNPSKLMHEYIYGDNAMTENAMRKYIAIAEAHGFVYDGNEDDEGYHNCRHGNGMELSVTCGVVYIIQKR